MTAQKLTDGEFDELKRKRDEATSAAVKQLCEKHGWEMGDVHVHVSHTDTCYCACPDGPCQHEWDGPQAELEGGHCISATCSRCGAPAVYHDTRVAP